MTNGHHLADDIFKCIFLNENVWIAIAISLKFVPKCWINNIPGLVQIMAWRRPGDKPLSEPMMVSLPMYICVTRPQWVNNLAITSSGKGPFPYVAWPEPLFLWGLNQVDGILPTTFWMALSMMPYGITKPQWVNPLRAVFLRGNKTYIHI